MLGTLLLGAVLPGAVLHQVSPDAKPAPAGTVEGRALLPSLLLQPGGVAAERRYGCVITGPLAIGQVSVVPRRTADGLRRGAVRCGKAW